MKLRRSTSDAWTLWKLIHCEDGCSLENAIARVFWLIAWHHLLTKFTLQDYYAIKNFLKKSHFNELVDVCCTFIFPKFSFLTFTGVLPVRDSAWVDADGGRSKFVVVNGSCCRVWFKPAESNEFEVVFMIDAEEATCDKYVFWHCTRDWGM